MIISIINATQKSKEDVQRVIRATNRQLSEDFRRYWHKDVALRLEGWTGEQPDPSLPLDMRGDAVLYLWDAVNVEDALGYHDLNYRGVPYGFVFTELSAELGEPWSVTLSHEALELAMDPEVNLLAAGPHPDPVEGGRIVYHWYELCDAVQAHTYEIDGVPVSDFVLPLYFTDAEEHQNHNDYLGTKLPSFGVGSGGYVGFFDPETGRDASFMQYDDTKAARRKEIKEQYLGVTRSDRHKDPGDADPLDNVAEFQTEAITVEIVDHGGGASASRERARQLVNEVLGASWNVRQTSGDPNEFDAIYTGTRPIPFHEAWDLAHALGDDADVVYAEPSLTFPVPGASDAPDGTGPGRAVRAAGFLGHENKKGTANHTWALELCNVPAAWELMHSENKQPGAGIRIGHPDSGFRPHDQLDSNRVLSGIDYDFLDQDFDAADRRGNHGLATGSVIISGFGAAGAISGFGAAGAADSDSMQGPALHSELLPLRVTKPGLLLPAPVLLSGGMHRLRAAIDYAIRMDCHVISMSLGGPPSRTLEKALERARAAGLIVLAAAGNYVRTVVWPARYDEVIGVAGCNIEKTEWKGSCRGDTVDVTAPAESVWRAYIDDENDSAVGRSFGTSFAVALTAGIAAMWLSYHGREFLIAQYGREQLPRVFRDLVKATAISDNGLPDGDFGAGIVDALALLRAELPDTPSPALAAHASGGLESLRRALAEHDVGRKHRAATESLTDPLLRELVAARAMGAIGAGTSAGRRRSGGEGRIREPRVSKRLGAALGP